MSDSKPCWVYVIGHQHAVHGDVVKVGISANVEARLGGLQTGSCEELTLFFCARLPDRDTAKQTESLFHSFYDDRRLKGEWFALEPGQAMFGLGTIISEIGRHLYLPERFAEEKARMGIDEALAPFRDADDETQALWVNDYVEREEGTK